MQTDMCVQLCSHFVQFLSEQEMFQTDGAEKIKTRILCPKIFISRISLLYLLHTSDLPTFEQNVVATFADDTAILAIGNNKAESTEKLKSAITKVRSWTRKWRIKINETKSVHIDFTKTTLSTSQSTPTIKLFHMRTQPNIWA